MILPSLNILTLLRLRVFVLCIWVAGGHFFLLWVGNDWLTMTVVGKGRCQEWLTPCLILSDIRRDHDDGNWWWCCAGNISLLFFIDGVGVRFWIFSKSPKFMWGCMKDLTLSILLILVSLFLVAWRTTVSSLTPMVPSVMVSLKSVTTTPFLALSDVCVSWCCFYNSSFI